MQLPRTRHFRFSLRTLIAAPFALCLVLAWWRMPYTISRPTGDGCYRKTVVRRDWNGTIYCHGTTSIHYSNGAKLLEYTNYDLYKQGCINDLLMPDLRCWDKDGREMSIEEVFEKRGMRNQLQMRAESSHLYGKRPATAKR